MARKVVCDICGKVIDKEGMWERYSLWMKDPNGENRIFPKRMDICYDCLEEISTIMKNKNTSKEVERMASKQMIIEEAEPIIDDFVCDECVIEKPKKRTRKKKEE